MPPRIREVIARPQREGRLIDRTNRHVVPVHPDRQGVNIAVPNHPSDEIAKGTLRDISLKAGWK
jgi:predicted RNA binding protein YcfA (HicA-like mRNA interferase family)